MAELKGSRTEKNLLAAFAGESQARNRYSFAADKAKKEGLEKIAAVFEITAEQERAHAKKFAGFLAGGEVEIRAMFPAGVPGPVLDQLKAAVAGETHEYESMYPEFARTAREEGFENIAALLEAVMVAERFHARRFEALARQLEAGTVFQRVQPVEWYCRKCGYIHQGTEAPQFCPACSHPRAYFEVHNDAY